MKLKEFLNKYKLYIIASLVVVFLVGILLFVLLNRRKSQPASIPQNKSIVSPYIETLSSVNLVIPTRKDYFTSDSVPVYNILPYKGSIPALVYKFDNNIKETYSSELIRSWIRRDITIVYYTSTGVFSIFTKDGIKPSLLINNKEDLLSFIQKYFSYTNINSENILISNNINGGYVYKGKYTIEGNEFGSADLDTYSFIVKTSDNGQVLELSILLYNPNSLTIYSEYVPMNEEQLLSEKRAYIKRLSISETYEGLDKYMKGTLSLSSLDIKTMNKGYIFSHFNHGYIYPAYIFSADARYSDFNKGMHIADVLLYFLAISPENVSRQEDTIDFHEHGTGNR